MAFTHRQLRNTCENFPQVQWIRHSQLGAIVLPKEYLAMLGDILGYHNWGRGRGHTLASKA